MDKEEKKTYDEVTGDLKVPGGELDEIKGGSGPAQSSASSSSL